MESEQTLGNQQTSLCKQTNAKISTAFAAKIIECDVQVKAKICK